MEHHLELSRSKFQEMGRDYHIAAICLCAALLLDEEQKCLSSSSMLNISISSEPIMDFITWILEN